MSKGIHKDDEGIATKVAVSGKSGTVTEAEVDRVLKGGTTGAPVTDEAIRRAAEERGLLP
jgi:hypothetical protein